MRKIFLVILIIGLFLATAVFSQQEDYPPESINRVGTTAATFLNIPVGARSVALSGAYTGLADDATALYWNPGGAAKIKRITLAVNHANLYAGITHDFVGLVMPIGQNVLGVSLIMLNSGDIDVTTVDEPEGTGESYNVNSMAAGITFGRQLTDRFSVGFTVKLINEKIWRSNATGMAVDIGSSFETGLLGSKIGMSISNFGPKMRMEGPDMINYRRPDPNDPDNGYNPEILLKAKDWSLPLVYRMGLVVDLIGGISPYMQNEKNRVTAIIDAYDAIDSPLKSSLGVEYEWNKMIALRVGYKINYDAAEFSFGGGLILATGNRPITVNYAFADYKDLNYIHHFFISMGF